MDTNFKLGKVEPADVRFQDNQTWWQFERRFGPYARHALLVCTNEGHSDPRRVNMEGLALSLRCYFNQSGGMPIEDKPNGVKALYQVIRNGSQSNSNSQPTVTATLAVIAALEAILNYIGVDTTIKEAGPGSYRLVAEPVGTEPLPPAI